MINGPDREYPSPYLSLSESIIGPIVTGFLVNSQLSFRSQLTKIALQETKPLSAEGMRKIQNQLVDRTLEFWQARSSQKLTREDAREIIENVTGFFQVLKKWQVVDQVGTTHEDTTRREI
jgi:hypothetical protein